VLVNVCMYTLLYIYVYMYVGQCVYIDYVLVIYVCPYLSVK
jgi:hypothetical protein